MGNSAEKQEITLEKALVCVMCLPLINLWAGEKRLA
jgi:hypothetical protein